MVPSTTTAAATPPDGLIYDVRLTSVGPGNVTGQDVAYEPSNVDLAMKLHYLRGVYYLEGPAFEELTVLKIKEPLFTLLNQYYVVCGRLRRAEPPSSRPYIKCNDCGVRFIEACCRKTLDEWGEIKDAALENLLTPRGVIGPELFFSPPVWIQLTKFKCGGVSLGLCWAHILGDVSSAVKFMNMFGKVIGGLKLEPPVSVAHSLHKATAHQDSANAVVGPLSIKKVSPPVGDHWIIANNSTMQSLSFYVSPSQLGHMKSVIGGDYGPFELISSILWRAVGRHRKGPEPRVVTVCKKGPETREDSHVSNSQLISTVRVGDDFSAVGEADLSELARLVKHGGGGEELGKIDEAVEREGGNIDVVLYGAKLTLVNMEDVEFYEFEWRGHKPIGVSYQIDGVGDEGCVLVLPGPCGGGDGEGRVVRVVLPEDEVVELKSELRKEWSIMND
ncbi:unnamed protein product [Cuscuta campestris]|uniref:Protein ECERIFERUM 26-like n=1 Tax=Cuscuta campestris TaxID=132261 RepID=A0A484NLG6_9ASTE|nr:unnamed protein product [Cuscuta campestris]